jgi:hypothetical protein
MEIIGQGLEPQDMHLEAELDVTLRLAGLDALLMWSPFDAGPYVLAGPSIGMKLYEEFRVTERILDPEGVTFLDGSREHELYDDPDVTRSMHLGVRVGFGYTMALNPDLALGIEALYLKGLQTVTETDEWSIQGLQATVALLFVL